MSLLEIIGSTVLQAFMLVGFMSFLTLSRRSWHMSGKEVLAYTLMVIMSFILGVLLWGM